MDNELESLFDDVFSDEPKETAEQTADDDGKQEAAETAAKEKGRVAAGSADPRNNAPQRPVMDKAERARQAAGRRNREREQIAQQAREAARAEMSAALASLGIRNPDDGAVIGTVDELEAYAKSLSGRKLGPGRASAADTRRISRETVQERPVPGGSGVAERELDMIREIDPAMTDLSAILRSDIGADFRRYVEQGATFIRAYGRAVRERSARADGARASQAAKAAGKGHLGATTQRGEGALSVPADVKSIWKALNPDDSEEEIQKYYNKDRKRFG